MLIAVAVLAAAVVGAVAWWLSRNGTSGADPVSGSDGFGAGRERSWELPLTPEARAAFMEGLRARHEAGDAVRVDGEQGVLTTYEPPRLISLHLLADAFAARGDAALHDPQETVAVLLERFAAAERPGVLHLRPGWLEGEVDGMDAARFAHAVGEIVRPGGWTAEAGIGALQATVPDSPDGQDGGGRVLTHVNGTPIKSLTRDVADDADGDPAGGMAGEVDLAAGGAPADAGTAAGGAVTRSPLAGSATTASAEPGSSGTGSMGNGGAGNGSSGTGGAGLENSGTGSSGLGSSGAGSGASGAGGGEVGGAGSAAVGGAASATGVGVRDADRHGGAGRSSGAGEPNTMLLDLARVLDRYREARAERPDAAAETLLREVVPRLIAAGGPGLTWTRPPKPGELRTALTGPPTPR